MKIGFVVDDTLDKPDGVQQYVLTLGSWLSAQGHQVHYLAGQTRRRDIPNVHSLARNIHVNFNGNRLTTPLPVKRKSIKKLLETEQYDVLHVQLPCSPWLAGRVIKAAGDQTAVVGTFHIVPLGWKEWAGTATLRPLLFKARHRLDSVISVSEPAKRFALHSLGLRSAVLPNVVNVAHYSKAKPLAKYDDGKINIVFLGRLVPRKGCLELLKTVAYLHAKNQTQNIRVIIAGRGQQLAELEKFVKDNHLGQVVHFVGFVREQDKPRLLATADIAVFPSVGGESFGIVLIEAMAAGAKVVLGGNNPGYKSVLKQKPDQLIDPHVVPSFAHSVRHFIRNGRARKSAYSWQSEHVKAFDVQTVGPKLLKAYTKALQSRANLQ